MIYKHEKLAPISPDVALHHWGYESGSAVGMRVVAALKQFNLLDESSEGSERELTLTDACLDLIDESLDQNEISDLALSPKIHRELWEKFDGEIPSDKNLERYLVKEKAFNPASVAKFIKVFRETLEFAGMLESDTMEEEPETGQSSVKTAESIMDSLGAIFPKPSPPKPDNEMIDLPITLPSLRIATLKLPKTMTEAEFKMLVDSLQAWKPSLVSDSDQKPSDSEN